MRAADAYDTTSSTNNGRIAPPELTMPDTVLRLGTTIGIGRASIDNLGCRSACGYGSN